jgi:hypothetical protein
MSAVKFTLLGSMPRLCSSVLVHIRASYLVKGGNAVSGVCVFIRIR